MAKKLAYVTPHGEPGNTFGDTLMDDTVALMDDDSALMADNDTEVGIKPGVGKILR